MKKIILSLVMLCIAFIGYSQTIVNTSPQNKKAVLEEFTGVRCVFCPQGHAIANAIKAAHPNDVFLINVHQGGYANPQAGWADFTTPFGNAIAGQTGLIGYPAGTVNRHFYPGTSQGTNGTTAQSRNSWTSTANQTLTQPSYVNAGVEASINVETREISVHVEVYYTGDSPLESNFVNIALLQDNTVANQVGGSSDYVHNHRLVHLITGQWGAPINTTTNGTFFEQTFTYTIPADYHGFEAKLADLKIVAFVTQNHQEIMTGAECTPEYTNIALANDAELLVYGIDDSCNTQLAPEIKITNNGYNTLTTLAIEYSANSGGVQTYNWTGNIGPLANEIITLPSFSYPIAAANTLNVNIPNDEDVSNNTGNASFNLAIESASNALALVIQTDNWGYECHWNIKDASGAIVAQSAGTYANNATINLDINLGDDCYTFYLIDDYGDGGNTVTLRDTSNNLIFSASGNYGAESRKSFSTFNVLSLEESVLNSVTLFPNPAKNQFSISNAEGFNVSVYSILGKEILTKQNLNNNETINTSLLTTGTYFVKIYSNNASKTEKLVIVK